MKNQVIEALNEEHGKKIIQYWKSQGFKNKYRLTGTSTRENEGEYRYYGIISGELDNYSQIEVNINKAEIILLPTEKYEEEYFIGESYVVKNVAYAYSIETLSDGTLCLMTDYDNTDYALYISYIKKVTDATKYSPLFIKALSYRLAAELALPRTESRSKAVDMMTMYEAALREADGHNASSEYVPFETGTSESWELAGR